MEAVERNATNGIPKLDIRPTRIKEPPMPIAIVGMSCRLPGGVSDLESFWDFCQQARNAWTEIPRDRINPAAFHHANPEKAGCVSRNLAFCLNFELNSTHIVPYYWRPLLDRKYSLV